MHHFEGENEVGDFVRREKGRGCTSTESCGAKTAWDGGAAVKRMLLERVT